MNRVLVLLILILTSSASFCIDFGEKGKVYPITEMNLLDYIYQKLNQYQREGKIDSLQQEFSNRVAKSALRPKGATITPAVINKSWSYDPTLVLEKDIANENGQLIASKGTKINPLNYINLSKELVFINSDIENEVNFANKKLQENPRNKIILVNGSVKKANQQIKTAVFFDQEQRLIRRFGIKHTPATVSQGSLNLEIKEYAL